MLPLSPKQAEVAEWVTQGKTNWEIGRIMGLSEHTVHAYVSACLRKFGVRSRTQLAVLLERQKRAEENQPA